MATNKAAFEAPSDRFAWYCASPINKYEPVILDASGSLAPATASTLTASTKLMGICQYGTELAGEMVTVVKGAFPVVADGAITAGQLVEVTDNTTVVNDFTYHTVKAASGDLSTATVIGVALTDATAKGDLVTVIIK